MNDNDKALSKIVSFLHDQPGSRPKTIAEELGVTRQYVQRLLANNKDKFSVSGSGPNRFYRNKEIDRQQDTDTSTIDNLEEMQLIEDNFYSLTPLGDELIGFDGFVKWCTTRKLDVGTKKNEYISIINKYYGRSFKAPIDFTDKLKTTLNDITLNTHFALQAFMRAANA